MTANVLNALASVLLDEYRPADAEPMFREALASLQQTATPEQWKLAIVRVGMGRRYAVLGRFSEAEAELLEAERLLAISEGGSPGYHRRAVQALVDLYAAWDQANPRAGHAAQAEQWRAKLVSMRPATAAASTTR
jgi:hypothetical protein